MKSRANTVKDFYAGYTEDELWLIKETEWV